jgi:hypothetical protein
VASAIGKTFHSSASFSRPTEQAGASSGGCYTSHAAFGRDAPALANGGGRLTIRLKRPDLLTGSTLFAQFDTHDPFRAAVALISLLGSLAGWLVWLTWGRRAVRRIGIEGLCVIALFAGLHIAVSYASRIGGYVLWAILGPFSVFLAGIGNEGLTSLLIAATIVLVPRPGTFLLSSATVFLINALFTGQFGIVDLLFVTISIVSAEVLLAGLGITTGRQMADSHAASASIVLRLAIAIGVANMATLYAQYCIAAVVYRLEFDGWYLAALSLVTGLLYGALGAAAGTVLGFRLRKTVL